MAEIKTDYIEKCLSSLELACQHLQSYKSTDDMYDICRAACYGDILTSGIFYGHGKNVEGCKKRNPNVRGAGS